MQKTRFYSMLAPVRISLAITAGLLLLAGCGSDDKDKKKEEDKKPAYERVVILKERFDQLENSLDEMERDLQLQKKRIESTRETAKSIKRSLIKGNLKGYSLDTVSTDPMVLQAMEERREKEQEKKAEDESKEETDDVILNSLLIILFIIFIIVIFVVALRDRTQNSPYEASNSSYPDSEPPYGSGTGKAGGTAPDTEGSSYEYERPNDLLPGGGDETPPEGPTTDQPDGGEPRQ